MKLTSRRILLSACIFLTFVASCSKVAPVDEPLSGGDGTLATALDATLTGAEIVYPPETQRHVYQKITQRISPICGGFWRALPASYSSSNNRKYPLIINLTGESQLGDGSQEQLDNQRGPIHSLLRNRQFPHNIAVGGGNFSVIIFGPQFAVRPNADEINEVINYVTKNYRIDQSRIYITGHSLGGGLCWDYGGKYGSKVAAIAPVCGASYPSVTKAKVMANAQLPVWAFHSEKDHRVPVDYTQFFVNTINKFSRSNSTLAKITIWPDPNEELKHDAWTNAYDLTYREDGKNVFEWLLSYKR